MIFATYRKRLKYLLIEVLGYPKQALPPFKVANEEVAAGQKAQSLSSFYYGHFAIELQILSRLRRGS